MRTGNDRRDFIKQGLFLAGAAGVLTSALVPIAARAQAVSKPVRRPDRYEDSFIFERKPYTWPGNKTLAVWIAPNWRPPVRRRQQEAAGACKSSAFFICFQCKTACCLSGTCPGRNR